MKVKEIHFENFDLQPNNVDSRFLYFHIKTGYRLVEKELPTLTDHMSSPRFLVGFMLLDL